MSSVCQVPSPAILSMFVIVVYTHLSNVVDAETVLVSVLVNRISVDADLLKPVDHSSFSSLVFAFLVYVPAKLSSPEYMQVLAAQAGRKRTSCQPETPVVLAARVCNVVMYGAGAGAGATPPSTHTAHRHRFDLKPCYTHGNHRCICCLHRSQDLHNLCQYKKIDVER